jgi:hypothetical protein
MAAYDYASGGFPSSPATNDTLIVHGTSYTYDGDGWVVVGATGLISSATAPASPSVGDQWFHTTDGILFTYVTDGAESNWIDISSVNGLAASSGGGGDMVKIASQSFDGVVTSMEFIDCFTSAYSNYFVTISGMAASSGDPKAYLSSNSGSTWLTTGMYGRSGGSLDYANIGSGFNFTWGVLSWQFWIIGATNSTEPTSLQGTVNNLDTSTLVASTGRFVDVSLKSLSVVNSFKLISSGATCSAGTVTIYGAT